MRLTFVKCKVHGNLLRRNREREAREAFMKYRRSNMGETVHLDADIVKVKKKI
jgi:hypothetical protein